jgi:hypothetical protein
VEKVKLIPRMKAWVADNYPGTKIGITEYSWGADGHRNGATAQADVLGIFGREGLDLATRWVVPASGSPAFNAIKMYRNYDGRKSAFGETAVQAGGTNPDQVAAFAAVRSGDGALTVMVINKQLSGYQSIALGVANFASSGPAQVWQLGPAKSITRLPDSKVDGGLVREALPPQSVTLFVLPTSPARR